MEKDETAELADWLRRLDAKSTEVAEDANFEGIHRGEPVIGPLIEALPKLGSYAQLSAIEIFEEVPDERSHPALIQLLLTSDSSTARDWAATALAHLEVHKAIPALWQAHAACRRRNIAPECTEPSAIRHALTRLGARTAVMPALTASLRVPRSVRPRRLASAAPDDRHQRVGRSRPSRAFAHALGRPRRDSVSPRL